MDDTLEQLIERHEGRRSTVYDDATGMGVRPGYHILGNLTIGVGHNLSKPLSANVINLILAEDLDEAKTDCLHAFPWFADLTEPRQWVLISLCFNMGLGRLLRFQQFLQAMSLGDYETAARELLDSKAARQLTARYTELANLIRGSVQT